MEFFNQQKPNIEKTLQEYLNSREADFSKVNTWGRDVCDRLYDFTINGKMIRGGLAVLSHQLYKGNNDKDALLAAVVMELYQSAFLIHDDIMDRDTIRRGKPSFFFQYKEKGDSLGYADSWHFGESLGICAGDVAFFLGFEIISMLNVELSVIRKIMEFCAQEVSYVGLAQMQDVNFGYKKNTPKLEEILTLYLYKTGRYTFSLPLVLGALIAGKTGKELALLGKLGEKLGLIFQIKDDELGLFGDEAEIGKIVGSDIKENKKSIFHHYLFHKADKNKKEELEKIFGAASVSQADINKVRETLIGLGIREEVNLIVQEIAREAERVMHEIEEEGVDLESLNVLKQLLEYSLTRTK